MSISPRGPALLKGALVAIDPANPLASVIIFQYNPQTVSRELTPRAAGGDASGQAEALRLSGAPVETISLEIYIDAIDQLERRDPVAVSMGIYPQLSALEMLIYPKSSRIIANMALAALGTIELIGPQTPLTLLIWGTRRVVPVRVTGLSISEETYDTSLNPIRARVNASLRVLTYSDLEVTNPGYSIFLTYQVVREAMATLGSVNNLSRVLGSDLSVW